METVLLMFSGGIDSTYLLHHYLTQTDLPVHAHHISVRYPRLKRWVMEDPAAKRIVDHCRAHYRELDYSESRFDMEHLPLVGSDQALQLLVAAKVGPNLPGEKVTVALGHCSDDFETPEAQERVRRRTMPRMWETLIESGTMTERLNPTIAKPMVEMELTKKDVCRQLPHELMQLCWSCRKPDYRRGPGVPCGTCYTCKQIKKVFDELGISNDYSNLVRERWLDHMTINLCADVVTV